jgi:hypothetical protein
MQSEGIAEVFVLICIMSWGARFPQTSRTRKEKAMARAEHKNLSSPDETRTFGHGKAELIQIGGGTIGRLTLEPGWRWSQDVKPLAGTAWCEAPHFQYQVSGRLHVVMEDGAEFDLGPGDVSVLPSGHDAWVIGGDPVVLVDWFGASNYAKE